MFINFHIPLLGFYSFPAASSSADIFMLSTLWEQFGDGPFLFQRDCAPVHKDQCAGLSGSSTPNSESHLNPAEALWDELAETVSRTFSSIVSV